MLLAFSCTVQKRHHTRGIYISFAKKTSNKQVVQLKRDKPVVQENYRITQQQEVEGYAPEASASPLGLPIKTTIFRNGEDSCDLVLLRNGEEFKAKVLEISSTEIRYKKCSMLNGPTFVSRRNEVYLIRYSNGSEQVFETTTSTQPVPQQKIVVTELREHPDATLSVVLGAIGLLLLLPTSIIAIVMGNKALREIHSKPHVFKGEESAKIGIVLGWIKVALVLIILALAFASLMY